MSFSCNLFLDGRQLNAVESPPRIIQARWRGYFAKKFFLVYCFSFFNAPTASMFCSVGAVFKAKRLPYLITFCHSDFNFSPRLALGFSGGFLYPPKKKEALRFTSVGSRTFHFIIFLWKMTWRQRYVAIFDCLIKLQIFFNVSVAVLVNTLIYPTIFIGHLIL